MNRAPNVPPLGVPLIGQQQQQALAAINQAVQQLSFTIYTQVATAHIATRDPSHQQLDLDRLQQLARDSRTAAEAFFEGLGLALTLNGIPSGAKIRGRRYVCTSRRRCRQTAV